MKDGTIIPVIIVPGFTLGEYVLEQRIGEGGMGEVWQGIQPIIEKRVAIKVLKPEIAQNETQVARFQREALAVNKIKHRNLIDIFSLGRLADGRPYFVMEFLEGKSLARYLKEKKLLPFQEIVEIMEQICGALQAAHDKGVIHRDLKPDNIFLTFEKSKIFVKILDFGIAKISHTGESGEGLTRTGAFMGTLAYMSPEQCRGEKNYDHRTDIYALGIVLYRMLCGITPFYRSGDNEFAVLQRQLTETPDTPSSKAKDRDIPKEIDALVMKMLSKNPNERPSSCNEIFEWLKKTTPKSEESLHFLGHIAEQIDPPSFEDSSPPEEPPAQTDITSAAPPPEHVRQVAEKQTKIVAPQNPAPKEKETAGEVFVATNKIPAISQASPKSPLRFVFAAIAVGVVITSAALLLPSKTTTPAEASPTPSAPTQGEQQQTIRLSVSSTPLDADVLLDGKLLGKTPLRTTTEVGTKEKQLTIKKEGYLPKEVSFIPSENYSTERELEAITIHVEISSTPDGAEVFLSGESLGKTPLAQSMKYKPGEQTLLISKEGYKPVETKLSLKEDIKQNPKLEKITAADIKKNPKDPNNKTTTTPGEKPPTDPVVDTDPNDRPFP